MCADCHHKALATQEAAAASAAAAPPGEVKHSVEYFEELININGKLNMVGAEKSHHLTKSKDPPEGWRSIDGCRLAKPVLKDWLDWLRPLIAEVQTVVFVAHGGCACDFRCFFLELVRAGLSLPASKRYFCLDTLWVIRTQTSKKNMDCHTCEDEDYQERTKKGARSFSVSGLVAHIIKTRAAYDELKDTFETLCGTAHDAKADVKGLVMVLTDGLVEGNGLWNELERKIYIPLAPFWGYATALWKFIRRKEEDPVRGKWTETLGNARPVRSAAATAATALAREVVVAAGATMTAAALGAGSDGAVVAGATMAAMALATAVVQSVAATDTVDDMDVEEEEEEEEEEKEMPGKPRAPPAASTEEELANSAPKWTAPKYSSKTGGPSKFLRNEIGVPRRGTVEAGAINAPWGVAMTPTELMLRIALFFLLPILFIIARATNSKAEERVISVVEGGKKVLRPPKADGSEKDKATRPRSKELCDEDGKGTVTGWEIGVLIAIYIIIGVFPRRRLSHYWDTTIPGLSLPIVSHSMTSPRFMALISMLSFMEVGDMSFPNDALRKLRFVNDKLRDLAQKAWDIEPFAAIDEARVKLQSKFCPFLWRMPCKPIQQGCTVYCLCFSSGYCWRWKWWLGGSKTLGMPTDQAALDEDGAALTSVLALLLFLILPVFNNTSCCFFLDKAFTSFKLIDMLAKRGIHVIGMMRAKRPKKKKAGRGWEDYWPFRSMDKSDEGAYNRGDVRTACKELARAGSYVMAILWLDNRWVTMVATTFLFASADVKRWSRSGHFFSSSCLSPSHTYHGNNVVVGSKEASRSALSLCPQDVQQAHGFC